MHEYKLSPLFFSQMRKTTLAFSIPLIIVAVCGGFLISGVAALLLAVIFILSLLVSLHKQQQKWSSYRLRINENSLQRLQYPFPEITIEFDEILKVTEADGRGLNILGLDIQTANPSRRILVPKTLHGYPEFRLELAKRCAINEEQKFNAK